MRILIYRHTDIAMFEALFITAKEVLLKPFFGNSTTFIKSGHISMGLVLTVQKHSI